MSGPSAEGSQDDSPTTDGELEACIGICDVGRCADGCKCSLKLKRKRPMVHAPAADLADGTFKRPPLFKQGDAVEFAAPERRIKVRTFGLVDAVKHVGAQPYYVVTSAKGTIYSFSEDCLRRKGSVDPNFALHGSELVTISDISAVGTVLMLESVDEVVDEMPMTCTPTRRLGRTIRRCSGYVTRRHGACAGCCSDDNFRVASAGA